MQQSWCLPQTRNGGSKGGPDIARKDSRFRQESDDNKIGGGSGKYGLVATMIS
jgi:hypothetical protein